MQAHQEVEPQADEVKDAPEEISIYEQFYQAAIKKNGKKIKQLLEQVSINFGTYQTSPICRLAAENNQNIIDYLFRKYGASPGFAIFGYAKGGHKLAALTLLDKTETPTEKLKLQQEMITGFAAGNNVAEVNAMLAQASTNTIKNNLLICAICGYGISGNIKAAEELMSLATNKVHSQELRLRFVASLAKNFPTEARKLIDTYTKSEPVRSFIESFPESEQNKLNKGYVKACGNSNHLDEAKQFIQTCDRDFQLRLYEKLIEGCGQEGNFAGARLLLAEQQDRNWLIPFLLEGTAFSGYIGEAKNYLAEIDENEGEDDGDQTELVNVTNNLVLYNLSIHHPKDALEFLQLLDWDQYSARLKSVISGMGLAGNERDINLVLEKAGSDEDRIELKIAYAEEAAATGHTDIVNNILQELPEENQHSLRLAIIDKYIICGYFSEAETIIDGTEDPVQRLEYTKRAILSYAENNCPIEAENLFDAMADSEQKSELLHQVVYQLARCCNTNEILRFINKAATNPQRKELFKSAIEAYLRNWHIKEINAIILKACDEETILELIRYYASIGKMNGWMEKKLQNLALFDNRNHLHEYILEVKKNPRSRIDFSENLSNLESLIWTLHQLIRDFPNENIKDLINRSRPMDKVMQQHHLSYLQALAWTDRGALEWITQPGIKQAYDEKNATDIYFNITTQLTGLEIPEIVDLCNKVTFSCNRDRFFKSLTEQSVILTRENCEIDVEAPSKRSKLR